MKEYRTKKKQKKGRGFLAALLFAAALAYFVLPEVFPETDFSWVALEQPSGNSGEESPFDEKGEGVSEPGDPGEPANESSETEGKKPDPEIKGEKAGGSTRRVDSGIAIPEITAAASIDSHAVNINWGKIRGAESYEVYRSDEKAGPYEKIGETSRTTYKDIGIEKGKWFYYKISTVEGDFRSSLSETKRVRALSPKAVSPEDIPEYSGDPVIELNGNMPGFAESQKKLKSFEYYEKLDSLGRCGTTFAMIGKSMMPEEERESIEEVRPSGFQNARYDDLIEEGFLFNRCHLIGFQLTGENANERNLITGTRYMNVEGMLPYENKVAGYIRRYDSKVLYRVIPIFKKGELVCRGVQMEAYSVEDNGAGVCFNVFAYNVQPGVEIDYETGASRRDEK